MINKLVLRILNLLEGFFRFFCFLCLLQEIISLFTPQDSLIEELFTEQNYLGIILYVVIFAITFIWVFKGIFEKIITKIYDIDNIKEIKWGYIFINVVRALALLMLMPLIVSFCSNLYEENAKNYAPKNIEFKINKSTVNIKMKYQSNNLYYSVVIRNFKYPSSDFMARTIITFIGEDGFEITKKEIGLKEYTQNNNSIEYVSHIPMSKENYKNISKVNLNYINPADSANSFARILNNIGR